MKTTDIIDHFTELDRSILKGEDAYVHYFNYLRDAFTKMIDSLNDRAVEDPVEINIIKSFVQKFLNTIEALRLKYIYERDYKMKVDLTDSSFPNHIEIRKLESDAGSKDDQLNKLPTEESLKRAVLDYLFEKQKAPDNLLKQLSRICYLKKLDQGKLFTSFVPGELVMLNEGFQKDTVKHYLYSWGSYDPVTNRPFIYILIFDHDENKYRLMGNKAAFLPFIENCNKLTHNSGPLSVMARDIDNIDKDIQPKVLKRIDLGPLYGAYSKDEHVLTKIIQSNFDDSEFVFLLNTEIVFSIGEKKEKGILSSGALKQIFFVDESDKECLERHISKLNKNLLASHQMVQYLKVHYKDYLQELTSPAIAFTNKI